MIEFIKRLFGIKSNKKRPQYTTKYVTETNSDDNDFIDITPFNKTGEILIHSPTKIESNDDYEEIIRYTVTKKDLSIKEMLSAIDLNKKFLLSLYKRLENSVYINEFSKVEEMLMQTETCYIIINSLNNNQIFHKNTIEIVRKHIIIIGKLVSNIKKLDLED